MPKQVIESLVKGGAASAGPPLGPALGPIGVNISEVIAEINKKTEAMKGMDVPVKVIVDSDTKEFKIEVGTPPTSALIKKEAKIDKGSGVPNLEKIADLAIDNIINIAKVKQTTDYDLKSKVKEVLGSCVSLGILVNGKDPRDVQKEIDQGLYDNKISGKEELKLMSSEEIEKRKTELKARAEKAKEEKREEEKPAKEGKAPAEGEEKTEEKKEEAPAAEEKKESK